jgi:membrane fusion protein (multidrug efflux system)
MSPRDRSVEATPLNRAPAPAAPPLTPAPSAEPSAPTTPAAPPATEPLSAPTPRRRGGGARFFLIVVVPLAALALGLLWWLTGGRYVSTDNAYVGADKVLITPQVTGAIVAVHVVEGQRVAVGDPLFDIDPAPYRTALALAQGRLAAAKVEFVNLRSSFASNEQQLKMSQLAVDLRQADFDRKTSLVRSRAGTQADVDTSNAALVQAKQILEFTRWWQESTTVKLGGGLDASIETFPDYMQAKAQAEDAERNLNNTRVTAPIAGEATQVDQIELGRVAPAGQPVFAIVATAGLWVEGNPKESDLTYVRRDQRATVTIDAFPGREWRGRISSIAPGTGAQFAILPPQNASGNWVKVVQRVPLRFSFDADQDVANLRSGMSAILAIDTGRKRTLSGLWSDLTSWAQSWLDGLLPAKAAATR